MKARLVAAVLVLLFFSLAKSGATGQRETTVRVLDENHQPVAGVPVTLLGLDRGPMTTRFEMFGEPGHPGTQKAKGWKFVTDAHGECQVAFGEFDFWAHLKATGIAEPGYGTYFLTVEKEGYAGGVSRKLLNFDDADRKTYVPIRLGADGPAKGEEWDYHARLLSDEPKDLKPIEIVLKRGIDVSGQLRDEKGSPIQGEHITLWNDLGADTHTGRGGEIFEREAETDGQGHFHFHHVYPNLFHLALEGQDDDSLCWLKTRVRQRWVDGVHDAIWPHTGDTDLPLVIVASRKPPYHYFGKVTDVDGKPIAGATVTIQASIHGPGERQDFEDSHDHHSKAMTRKDGTYDVPSAGQYVNYFEITAPGYQPHSYSEDGEIYGLGRYDEEPCAPGRYDFTLKRIDSDPSAASNP